MVYSLTNVAHRDLCPTVHMAPPRKALRFNFLSLSLDVLSPGIAFWGNSQILEINQVWKQASREGGDIVAVEFQPNQAGPGTFEHIGRKLLKIIPSQITEWHSFNFTWEQRQVWRRIDNNVYSTLFTDMELRFLICLLNRLNRQDSKLM